MLAASVSAWDIMISNNNSNGVSVKFAFQTKLQRYLINQTLVHNQGCFVNLRLHHYLEFFAFYIVYETVSFEFQDVKFVSNCTKSPKGSLIFTASYVSRNLRQRKKTTEAIKKTTKLSVIASM